MASLVENGPNALRPHAGFPKPTIQQTPPATQHAQIDPWILWVTFRRCWPWAIPSGAVLACLAAYYVWQGFVPQYRASHLLEANADYVAFKDVMPTLHDISRSERPLIYNPIVLGPVLADAEVCKAPSLRNSEHADSALRGRLSVANGGTSKLMVVNYTDTDPEAAAMVCNAVVDSYLRQRDAFDNARVTKLEHWLEPEILRWEREVQERHDRVQKLSQRTLGFAPGQRVAAMEDSTQFSLLQSLRAQIADLNLQLAIFDAYKAMRENPQSPSKGGQQATPVTEFKVDRIPPTQADIDELVARDGAVKEQQALIGRYKMQLLQLEENGLFNLVKDHVRDVEMRRDRATENLSLAKEAAEARAITLLNKRADEDFERRKVAAKEKLLEMEKEFLSNKQQALAKEKQERESIVAKMEVLQRQYSEEKSLLEKYGGDAADLQFAHDERKVASDVLTRLRDRFAAIRTERRQDGAVRSLAPATAPTRPLQKIPTQQMIKYGGAAFCIPFLIGLIWEFKIQRVADSESMEKMVWLAPVVGEVAKLPAGTQAGKGRRVFEESIDTLRSNLFLSVDTRHSRSIAIASSMSGEGKSCVASQLALSIAKATGETVLLVDADLRCPDQHEIFGLEMGPGLCGVLAGEVTLGEAVNSSFGDLIHILPAGKLSKSPHRLMSPSAMKDFVDTALQTYGFVVFDTAPVLSAGETLAIASAVDSTLVCVMRDVSRMDNVTRTTRRLEAAGATIAGTVFSGVSARSYAYRYGDYRYAVAGEVKA